MSTGTIVAGVAAVAGMFVGIPPQATFMAVSYLWGATHPNVIDGPQLTDLSVITAQAGGTIYNVYGSARISGNIIYSKPLKDIPETQSAKGASTEQKIHKYYATFAVGCGKGELEFGRVWINKKLYTTNSSKATVKELLTSSKKQGSIRFYNGSRSQRPDPVIQADAGVGKTSAYRGTAYVMFEDIPYDGSLSIEIEVFKNGKIEYITSEVFAVDSSYLYDVRSTYFTSVNQKNQVVYLYGFNNSDDMLTGNAIYQSCIITPDNTVKYVAGFSKGNFYNITFSHRSKSTDGSICLVGISETSYTRNYFCAFPDGYQANLQIEDDIGVADVVTVKDSEYMFLAAYDNSSKTKIYQKKFYGKSVESSLLVVNAGFRIQDMALGSNYLFVLDNLSNVHKFDIDDLEYKGIVYSKNDSINVTSITCESDIVYFVGSNYKIYKIDNNDKKLIASIDTSQINYTTGKLLYLNSNFYLASQTLGNNPLNVVAKTMAGTDISLDTVVKDLCLQSGLTENEIDVTDIADIYCRGYVIANIMTSGAAIEQLANYFFFDIVESDDKIKFVKRGKAPVAVIPEDDLAAHPFGAELPDDLTTKRQQSLELPNKVTLKFMDIDSDYQVNSQVAQRYTINTQASINPEVAVVMNSTQAKTMANRILYSQWLSRKSYTLYLSNKYLYLEPSDVIEVQRDDGYETMRITEINYQNGVLTVNAVAEDMSIYDVVEVSDSANYRNSTLASNSSTDVLFLDLPLLRDQDDSFCYYLTANGLNPNDWTGTQIYKSLDNGSSYSTFNEWMTRKGVFGTAKTVLPDWKDNVIDYVDHVVVKSNGALTSKDEINVLNGENVCLIGDEILQYTTVESLGNNEYKLSGLIRSRLGTEWAKNKHVANERFVVLNLSTLYIISSNTSEIGLERDFKAVSQGETLDDAFTVKFTNNANAQKPYSPVHLGGGRDAAGNLQLQWVRRTRINGGWNNNTDVPLGETSEKYSVDILDNSNHVVRTIDDITNPYVIYTSAQQITDFGSVQSQVKFTVYQVSSTVGRGFGDTATI